MLRNRALHAAVIMALDVILAKKKNIDLGKYF
jgi:hypothetical protein